MISAAVLQTSGSAPKGGVVLARGGAGGGATGGGGEGEGGVPVMQDVTGGCPLTGMQTGETGADALRFRMQKLALFHTKAAQPAVELHMPQHSVAVATLPLTLMSFIGRSPG